MRKYMCFFSLLNLHANNLCTLICVSVLSLFILLNVLRFFLIRFLLLQPCIKVVIYYFFPHWERFGYKLVYLQGIFQDLEFLFKFHNRCIHSRIHLISYGYFFLGFTKELSLQDLNVLPLIL